MVSSARVIWVTFFLYSELNKPDVANIRFGLVLKKRIDVEIYLLAIGQTLAWASIYYIFPAFLLKWEQDFYCQKLT